MRRGRRAFEHRRSQECSHEDAVSNISLHNLSLHNVLFILLLIKDIYKDTSSKKPLASTELPSAENQCHISSITKMLSPL